MPTFITNNNPGLSKPITLSPEDLHHALNVLRLRIGENIQVTDNQGTIATATLKSAQPLHFEITNRHIQNKARNLTIYLPLIDRDRLEWCIEKLTELNVTTIQLVSTERSQKSSLNENQFKRLNTLAESAQKQCGRAWPITIRPVTSFNSLNFDSSSQIFYGCANIELNLSAPPKNPESLQDTSITAEECIKHQRINNAASPLILCIGPEGGFSTEEISKLKSHQGLPIHVGETVFRAETAAIVLTSLLLYS